MYNNQFGYNPYYQPLNNNFNQPMTTQNTIQPRTTLNGKLVDSVDMVKVADVNLDGSTSYFPLTDGSAIITKRLLNDGTSKTTIYKPIEDQKEETPKYVTYEDLEDLKSDIEGIKQELKATKKGAK